MPQEQHQQAPLVGPPPAAAVAAAPTSAAAVKLRKSFYMRQLPGSCVSFSCEEGRAMFKEALAAGHMEVYFKLAEHFLTQDDPAFCGLSTLTM
jgi:Phytochelatin synthase